MLVENEEEFANVLDALLPEVHFVLNKRFNVNSWKTSNRSLQQNFSKSTTKQSKKSTIKPFSSLNTQYNSYKRVSTSYRKKTNQKSKDKLSPCKQLYQGLRSKRSSSYNKNFYKSILMIKSWPIAELRNWKSKLKNKFMRPLSKSTRQLNSAK